MKRFVGGLAAVALALTVGTEAIHAAPGDTIDAEYNFAAAGVDSFTFSDQLGGNAWRQTGDVISNGGCTVAPIGAYVYYPALDYTVFWILGFNEEGGAVDIRGTVWGQDIAGWAGYVNHCNFGTGLYWMSPPAAQPTAP